MIIKMLLFDTEKEHQMNQGNPECNELFQKINRDQVTMITLGIIMSTG